MLSKGCSQVAQLLQEIEELAEEYWRWVKTGELPDVNLDDVKEEKR